MPLKELLLNSSSFTELLKQHSINPADFTIKDEGFIVSDKLLSKEDVFKEMILIEGHNESGRINLIGTIYCNFVKNIAVFELESAERVKEDTANA
ncbi:hypothetical protein [Arcticibacter tournemirensis]|uniref:Uncharacterized protein n=1 Tax=Arcticibacter tournemirensis TaxID=699437 RepID=A0A4Q0M8S2_9SPHI|nr:hypothetical protein [Arcticibacter tournemirensis]RXF69333.1 hypothetical protein EKH83_11630 [Arcticibacter tournemirensis]